MQGLDALLLEQSQYKHLGESWLVPFCNPSNLLVPGDYLLISKSTQVPGTLDYTPSHTGNQQQSHNSVQFNSVTQWCPTLCDTMNRSMPGLPVHHQLPEFTQTHVHRVGVSSSLLSFSSCPQSFLASESFPMSQLFTRGGQSIGVSALASVLPKKFLG